MKMKKISAIVLSMLLILSVVGCKSTPIESSVNSTITQTADTGAALSETTSAENNSDDSSKSIISSVEGSILDTTKCSVIEIWSS